ncbi:NHL repeat-containing protein [Paludisphaera rhizosphaerae]|uniref:peptidase n=1 Tax=Paludisphaera rhizosphaerae TaxID=2711216 RepID=UPI0013E9BD2C|nr:peptidase [Paludisphaera rhizosphaerae]
MDRREFLRRGAVAATAATTAAATGPFIHADDKAGSKTPTVGEGDHRYECRHDFFQAPGSIHWYETHGVAVDSQGFIYIAHRGGATKPKSPTDAQDTIAVFDPEGKFVRSFGKQFHGGGHGVDVRRENGVEYLYLACMMPVNLVAKTDLKGEVVWIKEAPTEPHVYDDPKAKFAPTNVAFGPDGDFFVADGYGSHYVHKYDKDAKWVKTFGGAGTEEGKFKTPHGIWLDDRPGRQPVLVVADRANARLQHFTLDGEHVGEDFHNVSLPASFDIRGDVLLVPDLYARVTLLDGNDKLISHLGDDPEWTKAVLADGRKMRTQPDRWKDGKFVHPHDACFDHDGNILVAEWVSTGRLTRLKRLS